MTFESCWQALCRKKPLLTDPSATVEIRSDAMKRLLEQVYEQGRIAGKSEDDNPLDWLNSLIWKGKR